MTKRIDFQSLDLNKKENRERAMEKLYGIKRDIESLLLNPCIKVASPISYALGTAMDVANIARILFRNERNLKEDYLSEGGSK